MNLKRILSTLTLGALAGAVAAAAVLVIQGQPFHLSPVGMTYADLAATLLAAAALLTTLIGLFIAALAIWGFTALRSFAKSAAKSHVSQQLKQGELRSHVENVVTAFLKTEFEDGNLRQQLEEHIDEILITAPSSRAQESGTTDDDVAVESL